jgi:hypothetical protein
MVDEGQRPGVKPLPLAPLKVAKHSNRLLTVIGSILFIITVEYLCRSTGIYPTGSTSQLRWVTSTRLGVALLRRFQTLHNLNHRYLQNYVGVHDSRDSSSLILPLSMVSAGKP